MSGFSPDWLDLREPADRQARCKALQVQVATYFADRDSISICDLGAGTGATVRALHPLLPRPQTWRLVDHAAENLQAAEARLRPLAEADALTIHFQVHDLADDPAPWDDEAGFVTASALFDLTSTAWIETLVARLAERQLPLLGLLTYDGRLEFANKAPEDKVMHEAFDAHQQTDKGFGPAAGPNATLRLEAALANAGYRLFSGDSTWELGSDHAEMRQAVIDGWAGAAREMAVDEDTIQAWLRAHADAADILAVGHTDLFAHPAR